MTDQSIREWSNRSRPLDRSLEGVIDHASITQRGFIKHNNSLIDQSSSIDQQVTSVIDHRVSMIDHSQNGTYSTALLSDLFSINLTFVTVASFCIHTHSLPRTHSHQKPLSIILTHHHSSSNPPLYHRNVQTLKVITSHL